MIFIEYKYKVILLPIISNINPNELLYQKYLERIDKYIVNRQTRHKEAPAIFRWLHKNPSQSRLSEYIPFITLILPTSIVTNQHSTSSSHDSNLCSMTLSKVKSTISNDSLRIVSDIHLTTGLAIIPPTQL